jgi:hypothetical protein
METRRRRRRRKKTDLAKEQFRIGFSPAAEEKLYSEQKSETLDRQCNCCT